MAKPTLKYEDIVTKAKELLHKKMEEEPVKETKSKSTKKTAEHSSLSDNFDPEVLNTFMHLAYNELITSLNAYTVNTNITALVKYINSQTTDILRMTAICPVIRPDFILMLDQPLLDFDCRVIGSRHKITLPLMNLSDKDIKVTMNISPTGPFTEECNEYVIEAGLNLNLPVSFNPVDDKQVREYIDIQSDQTSYTIQIMGVGVHPEIVFLPEASVARLTTKYGSATEYNLEIINKCRAPIQLKLVKSCELEGKLIITSNETPISSDNSENVIDSRKKSRSPSVRSPKIRQPKLQKFTSCLTLDEEYSISDNFVLHEGESFFALSNGFVNDNYIEINPFEKTCIKIKFEDPNRLQSESGKIGRKMSGKIGGKKQSDKNKPKGIRNPFEGILFITKFDMLLGESTFLKDIILIGAFE